VIVSVYIVHADTCDSDVTLVIVICSYPEHATFLNSMCGIRMRQDSVEKVIIAASVGGM